MAIPRPKQPLYHLDRQIECQSAVESGLQRMVSDAAVAGWLDDEIVDAFGEFARTLELAQQQRREMAVNARLYELKRAMNENMALDLDVPKRVVRG